MNVVRRDGTSGSVRRIAILRRRDLVATGGPRGGLLARSETGHRRVIAARMRGRIADGADFESLYVRDIQQREAVQATTWLRGRTPRYEDLKLAAGALGAPIAVLLGERGPFRTSSGRRVFSPAFEVSSTPLGTVRRARADVAGARGLPDRRNRHDHRGTGKGLRGATTLAGRNRALGTLVGRRTSGTFSSAHGSQVFDSAPVSGTSWRLVGTEPAREQHGPRGGRGVAGGLLG